MVMSMYTQLLDAALKEVPLAVERTIDEDMSSVRDCHARLASNEKDDRTAEWSFSALANQVAYDLALIELARRVGIDCAIKTFQQPENRRTELMQELNSHGVVFDA
jgi:hypothetical protein